MTTPVENLSHILADDLKEVNAEIQARMQSESVDRIGEISAYLVDAGGKRIRPILSLASARACGYDGAHHIALATAVEFIHTATLLHDDVVDESEKRRGKKTANLMWDNKSSVLVGDYLFSRAFQAMVETQNLAILDVLANASATIAEGEVLQLASASNIELGEDTYFKIITGKTAALFSAATETGAMIAGQSEKITNAFADYGMKLGLAFQIADDILDFTGDEKFGKTIGNDFAERKLTLPIIRAIAESDGDEKAFWHRTISRGKQDDNDLREAVALIRKYEALESARESALKLADEAKAALSAAPNGEIKNALSQLADYVVDRVI